MSTPKTLTGTSEDLPPDAPNVPQTPKSGTKLDGDESASPASEKSDRKVIVSEGAAP